MQRQGLRPGAGCLVTPAFGVPLKQYKPHQGLHLAVQRVSPVQRHASRTVVVRAEAADAPVLTCCPATSLAMDMSRARATACSNPRSGPGHQHIIRYHSRRYLTKSFYRAAQTSSPFQEEKQLDALQGALSSLPGPAVTVSAAILLGVTVAAGALAGGQAPGGSMKAQSPRLGTVRLLLLWGSLHVCMRLKSGTGTTGSRLVTVAAFRSV